jgi:thioredoxin-dependent peroxiredoxin
MGRIVRRLVQALMTGGLLATFGIATNAFTTDGLMMTDELKVGDQAPDFTLPGSDGQTHTLSALKGKTVVLAWFPKAFTGG